MSLLALLADIQFRTFDLHCHWIVMFYQSVTTIGSIGLGENGQIYLHKMVSIVVSKVKCHYGVIYKSLKLFFYFYWSNQVVPIGMKVKALGASQSYRSDKK